MDLSYIINRLGEEREHYFNAVSPPLIQTSNFAFPTVEAYRKALANEQDVFIYSRGNNPTTDILCKKLAALQGSEEALVFSSGMAAISAAVLSQLKAGDHVICVENVYGWTRELFTTLLGRYGVETTWVDGKKTDEFKLALRENTRVIYLESPNSLLLECQDLRAVAQLAAEHGIVTVLDNSYAGLLSRSPIEMGIDVVVHSASKYIGGHSDMVAGVLCASSSMIKRLFNREFMTLGGVISPHDAWLMIRSLRTLPLRLRQSSQSAQALVAYLDYHPRVERVYYPHSPSFEQRELALDHMPEPMAMFTIQLAAQDVQAVERFCNSLEYFLLAPSWGGHESLVFPTCVFHGEDSRSELPFNLVRVYVGLEECETLKADLDQALSQM